MTSLRRRTARPSKLPAWEHDLNGTWQAVELLADMDSYEERRDVLEKLADGEFQFDHKVESVGVSLCARVTYPYTVMVGLRPGPGGYMGKHVPLSHSHPYAHGEATETASPGL